MLRTLEAEKTAALQQGGFAAAPYGGPQYGGPQYGGQYSAGQYGGAVMASGPTYGLQSFLVLGDSGFGLRLAEPEPASASSFDAQRGQLFDPVSADGPPRGHARRG